MDAPCTSLPRALNVRLLPILGSRVTDAVRALPLNQTTLPFAAMPTIRYVHIQLRVNASPLRLKWFQGFVFFAAC